MIPLFTHSIFVLSLFRHTFAQSLFQEPASSLTNLSIDADIDKFSPAIGGVASNLPPPQSQCFRNIPGYPQFRPVARVDCYLLFFNFLVAPTAATAFRWESSKLPLAVYYKYGSCTVSVYAASPTSKETFMQLGIARVAALVVQDCVTAPRGYLGGRHTIGDTGSFWIAVGKS